MCHKPFSGLGIALATPFNADETVDYATLGRHVDMLANAGVDFLVALGTTAETPTLAPSEQAGVLATVKEHAAGVPVVVGVGGNCTRSVVERLKAFDPEGLCGILSVAPYYNKPTQTGLMKHFAAVAEASPLPVILYNVPSRTGVNIDASTTLALAGQYPGKIVAIKEASGRLEQVETILNRRDDSFAILSGDDSLAHTMIKMGAEGVISVLGNVYPREFGRLIHATIDGDIDSAATLHQRFSALYTLLFREGNPSGIKAALHSRLGYYPDTMRLPLTPVSDATAAEIDSFISSFDTSK